MPLVNLVMTELKVKLPQDVKPIMLTGFESLGRNHELQRLSGALGTLGQLLPNGEHLEYLNKPELIERIMNASRVDMHGLLKSEQEVQKGRQQAQQDEVMKNIAPQIAEAAKQQKEQQ
jgi:hypothetical protein